MKDLIPEPRWSDKLFLDGKLQIRIVESEIVTGASIWSWLVQFGGFSIDGGYVAPSVIETEIVLMKIVTELANPETSAALPSFWAESWERRWLWEELKDMRREVLTQGEGASRTLN